MITNVTYEMFDKAFGESMYRNKFSTQGLIYLFKFFEELDEKYGHETTLSVDKIAKTFTEYACLEEFFKDYSREKEITTLDELEKHTAVIYICVGGYCDKKDGRFIIRRF